MHVNVLIPTYDRWALLRKCIDSLRAQSYQDFSIHIIADGSPSIPSWAPKAAATFMINEERQDAVASYNNLMKVYKSGAVLNATDDLVFSPHCLSHAVYVMESVYPKGQAVIGINQLQDGLAKGRRYAFSLMSEAYVRHFPGLQVFCPDYIHYRSDMEHGIYAQSIKRFLFCRTAEATHVRLADRTTELGKQVYKRDKHTWQRRQARGFLWGKNFDRLK